MPSRRSTTNLLQASGELWSEDAEQAPLQFIVLTPDSTADPRIEAVVNAALQLAPDDVALSRVAIDALPPFDDEQANGSDADGARIFRDEIAVADGFLLIALAEDAPAQDLLVRALNWAATPAGEDALAGLPVVWLGLGGDSVNVMDARLRVETAIVAGGGVTPDDAATLGAPLAGDWEGRLGSEGRLEDIPSRQAIGQVLIRLRQMAFAGEEDVPEDPTETDQTNEPVEPDARDR